jgi:hypothetical protein
VVDAHDAADRVVMRSDGAHAADYFYRIRSNLSHRGKSAFRDGQLVFTALVQLHDAIRALLADQLPTRADEWRRREPKSWTLCHRIRGI